MMKKIIYCFICYLFVLQVNQGIARSADRKSIRSRAIYEHKVDAGHVESNGALISLAEYDQEGQMIQLNNYALDGSILSEQQNEFDGNHQKVKSVTTSVPSAATKTMVYEYDNKLLTKAYSYTNGDLTVILEYSYLDGRLEEMITRSVDNTIVMSTKNQFDAQGNIVDRISLLNGQEIGRTSMEKTQGKMVSLKKNRQGDLIQGIERKYNGDGKLRETIQYDPEGRIMTRTTKSYDEKKRVSEILVENPLANMKTKTIKKYDERGHLKEEIKYNKLNEPVKVVRMHYQYFD